MHAVSKRHPIPMNPITRVFLSVLVIVALCPAALVQSQMTPYQVVDITMGTTPSSVLVQVSCVFDNAWTADTHPIDYPSSSAHWSTMVLVSHSSNYEMWAPQIEATPGVQSVAEVMRMCGGVLFTTCVRACSHYSLRFIVDW